MVRNHPARDFGDPLTYTWEPVYYGVHYNKAEANAASHPYPYDVSAQRDSWLINCIKDWVEDEGWLKKNYGENGNFVYCSGVVWSLR